jgi:hypothetical protein
VIGPFSQTFTGPSSVPIKLCGLRGQNTLTFQVTAGTAGPVDANGSNDGITFTSPITISTMAGAAQTQPFTPTGGSTYQVGPLTTDCVEIAPDSTWGSQNATLTYKASSSLGSSNGSTTGQTLALPTFSPGPAGAVQNVVQGSGSTAYLMTYPDTWAFSSNIVTATTTLLVSGVANQNMYLFEALGIATGANASAQSQLIAGTGALCAGSTFNVTSPAANAAALYGSVALYGGGASGGSGVYPSLIPYIIKSTATPVNLCVVTTGTTTSIEIQTGVAIHAN